jgi:hypothetical protein
MRMVSLTGMVINGTGALWKLQKRYASRKIPSLHETNRRNQWINNTVVPHFNTVKERKNLSATQKAILTVDLWPIHTAKTDTNCFLPWMKATYPWIATIFIPGGCEYLFIRDMLVEANNFTAGTPLVQPADVGINCVFKHKVKQSALDFFAGGVVRKLAEGIEPEKIEIPMDLLTLHDASVAWTLDAWHYFHENPNLVRQAWADCKVGDLDFSWESLTSALAMNNLEDLLANDEIFRKRIGSKDPSLPYSSDPAVRDTEAETFFDDTEDDSSASVDKIAIAPKAPASQSLEIAAEDFDFDVGDEDEDAEPYKMDNGEREEANEVERICTHTPQGIGRDEEDSAGWMTGDDEVYNQMNLTNYEELDCTPPVSDTDDVMAGPSQTVDDSLALHSDSEESVPILDNDHLDASDEETVNPSSNPNPPHLYDLADSIMFDIATYGVTNPAALASPVKPRKSTKPKCKMTRNMAAPPKSVKDVNMSVPQPSGTSDTTPDASSRPKRQRKLPPKFDDAGSDESGIEAELTQKKRKTRAHK